MRRFLTLFEKELIRFWKVAFQTIAAPIITALLYQMVFSHALSKHVEAYPGVAYAAFLIPGLAMMSMVQNAFANTSSSLIQSKITGNIIFILLPPITVFEFFSAYLLAAVVRGVLIGIGIFIVTLGFGLPMPVYPIWAIIFAILGCMALGSLGIIAGIWAEKFDQMAAFQNFIIMPLTFLAGVFYSVNSLSPFWKIISHINPIFYMVDGFRYGFFGHSDVAVGWALWVVVVSVLILCSISLYLLKIGYRLRY